MKQLILLFVPAILFAQEPMPRFPMHVVRAVGEATVKVKPDQVQISIGTTTQSGVAADALSQNNAKMAAITNALKTAIGNGGELKTSNFTVMPQYRYEQGKSPAITGYQATQMLDVTLNDITLVGKVIDAASQAGANDMNRIDFTLKDEGEARAQAIAKATSHARMNAETIAKSLGVSVEGVAWAETTEVAPIRPLMAPMMKAQAMVAEPAQIESGTIEIHASVTVALNVK